MATKTPKRKAQGPKPSQRKRSLGLTTIYKDKKGEWRWNLTKNKKIIAASSEGYKRRIDAEKNLLAVSWGIAAVVGEIVRINLAGPDKPPYSLGEQVSRVKQKVDDQFLQGIKMLKGQMIILPETTY